jgi:ribulose-5-phosphate 4-epimerase/fuculose-1-phosphate aldolase
MAAAELVAWTRRSVSGEIGARMTRTDGELSGLERLRHTVATACRILGARGLAEDVLGHVSVRVGDDRLLVRCRGPQERGLMFTTPGDVRLVDLDGEGELYGGYEVPNELPIHTELLRRRPEVTSVVHAHPPAVLVTGLADVRLRPVFGAYNMPAARMALDGVPVFPRSVLIRRRELAAQMCAAMEGSDVCVLRGHGITTAGTSVEQAVVRALNLDSLARVNLELARLGALPDELPVADVAELPDLGAAFNDLNVWRHHTARLAHEGLALPPV